MQQQSQVLCASPQSTAISWFKRNDLPDRYGPMTTTGAKGPSNWFKNLSPSSEIDNLVVPGEGRTMAYLQASMGCTTFEEVGSASIIEADMIEIKKTFWALQQQN